MSSHHDHNDHHVSESKPVSFGVPIILGLVTTLVILLFVSLGDPCHCHGECQAEAAEHHTEATAAEGHEAHHEAATEVKTEAAAGHEAATEEVKAEEVKTEAAGEAHHHTEEHK